MPFFASPLCLWTCVEIFCYWWAALWSRSFPVWLCSCLLPLLSCLEPAPWLIGAALCCPVFLLCGPAFWWFVQLSLVLDLTMWPRLLWHHMVPSSARDRRAHTHPPLPANHAPWSKTAKYFASVCLHLCVSDKQLKRFTNTHITNSHIHHESIGLRSVFNRFPRFYLIIVTFGTYSYVFVWVSNSVEKNNCAVTSDSASLSLLPVWLNYSDWWSEL